MRPCPRCGAPSAMCAGSRLTCRNAENSSPFARILLVAFGAALGSAMGVALGLPGYWHVLPAILGAAVGLAAGSGQDDQRRPYGRQRAERHFGDPPP